MRAGVAKSMAKGRSIPSLDGLRALAVLAVVFAHSSSPLWVRFPWLEPVRNGGLGVTCFFAISGLLITKLLLNELDTDGRISMGRFYARRFFRIFPPFYVYLAVVGILSLIHFAPFDLKSFLYAAAYLRNYAVHPFVLVLEHTWSLSLEEQFYLLWPACLFFFRPRTCLWIAFWAIVLSPVLRVGTYALVPGMRDHVNMMLHTRLDAIMVGAFVSLAQHQRMFTRTLAVLRRPVCLVPVFAYFVAQPWLSVRFGGGFSLPVGFSLDAFTCGVLIWYAIETPESALGRVLNVGWLRHLGIISYSLYLWQQVWTGPYTKWFPLNLIPIWVCAELSYWLVEKPSFRLRNLVMRRPAPVARLVEVDPAVERGVA